VISEPEAVSQRLQLDQRVRVLRVPGGRSRAQAWNIAWRESRGEFIGLLDADDLLSPSALFEMAAALELMPYCDVLYSDEDRIALGSWRFRDPHFKPDWSPEYLLARNYIGRLTMIRRDCALAVGGFRDGYDGAEEWDLFLRLSRHTPRIKRLPRCLYHRRRTASWEEPSQGAAAVKDHCARLGLEVAVSEAAGEHRVVWSIKHRPMVSIIIPSRDAAAVITTCVRGLIEHTSYSPLELVIVDNGTTEAAALSLYRSVEEKGCGVVIPLDRPFNFSAACNAGAMAARGDLLLFLNNDIEVFEPHWLEELVRWSLVPEVGIVGAKLLYPDRTIQHAGVVFGIGLVGHIFCRAPEGASGLFGSSESYRNYLGVTGACQMMRRDVFDRLGGYDERFRLSFSDITLCLEAWKAGYRVVYTPHARLIHHESHTRKREDWPEDLLHLVEYLETNKFVDDPYFHPELNARSAIPALRPFFAPSPKETVRNYMDRVLTSAERTLR
jgi:GT2 family glycosyltransferase